MSSAQTNTSPQYAYKAALAMNNMAITMMERKCYSQAYETLKDAASAMTVASQFFKSHQDEDDDQSEETSTPCCCSNTSAHIVRRKLHSADSRCANPEPTPHFTFPVTSVSHNRRVYATDFSAKSASQELTDTSVCRIIRIDTEDDTDILEDIEVFFDLSSAIILYNYSVASLARSGKILSSSASRHNSTSSKSANRRASALRESAVKLLTLSGDMLSRLYESCEDSMVLSRILFASATLLQLLSKTLITSGQIKEAESCISTLEFLCTVAEEELDYMDDSVAALYYESQTAAAA